MQVVAQDDERAGRAIEAALGVTVALPFVGLVVTEGEILVAALVFNNFDRINVDLSITVFSPLKIGPIRDIARYVFGRLGVARLTCATLTTNVGAINRLETLGFVREGTLRRRFKQGDAYVYSLLADEQKFARLNVEPAPSP